MQVLEGKGEGLQNDYINSSYLHVGHTRPTLITISSGNKLGGQGPLSVTELLAVSRLYGRNIDYS